MYVNIYACEKNILHAHTYNKHTHPLTVPLSGLKFEASHCTGTHKGSVPKPQSDPQESWMDLLVDDKLLSGLVPILHHISTELFRGK